NSHSSTNNQSALIFAEMQQKQDWGQLIHQLNYQQIDNARESSSDRGVNWMNAAGSKDWANTEKVWEGATSADIDLKQSSVSYVLDALLITLNLQTPTIKSAPVLPIIMMMCNGNGPMIFHLSMS